MPTPSATGSGQGGTVFTPPGQPTAAYNFRNVLQPEINQSVAGLDAMNTAPATLAWPYVQQDVMGIQSNPYAAAAQTSAQDAASIAKNQTVPATQMGGGTLEGLGALAAQQAPGTLAAGNSAYSTLTGQVPGTLALGGAVANTAFDPQNALFNRTQQQLLDQSSAVDAMSGVANTPYGASVTSNALGNFDINWQNSLLGRQNTGLSALEGANTNAGNLETGGLNALFGANTNLGGLAGTTSSAFDNAASLYGYGGAQALAGGSQPYNTSTGISNAGLSALSQLINLGNANYSLPNSVLTSLSNYLNLGQGASATANTIGSTNFNELAAGAGGAGSLLGSGLGLGSPSNPGYLASALGGLGSLGGGVSSGFGPVPAAYATPAAYSAFGGTGLAGDAGATLASAAPAAALS